MKRKSIFGLMALGLLLGTVACSSGEDEASKEGEEASTEVTEETAGKLEAAKDAQGEAIVLDAEVDEFVESL